MEQSTTYQAIIERGIAKGELIEARNTLLRLGSKKFGPPAPDVTAAIAAISDKGRLEDLTDRVLTAASWGEIGATH
jgi:hypothetical protein